MACETADIRKEISGLSDKIALLRSDIVDMITASFTAIMREDLAKVRKP
jgi:hypothetical protein